MPLPIVFKIDTLDLLKNKAIGVSIPFDGKGVFNSTFDTKTQLKSNLFNLILTNRGERLFNPLFGSDIRRYLFEGIDDEILEKIEGNIIQSVELYIPQITINNVTIDADYDNHKLDILIDYSLTLSGQTDVIKINFQ